MGFFTDLKEDLSQAVNELMPEEDVNELHAAHDPEAEAEQELPSPVEDDLASEEDIWAEKENWADDTEWEDDPDAEELSAEDYANREMTEKLNTMLEKLDEQEQEQAGYRQTESLIEAGPDEPWEVEPETAEEPEAVDLFRPEPEPAVFAGSAADEQFGIPAAEETDVLSAAEEPEAVLSATAETELAALMAAAETETVLSAGSAEPEPALASEAELTTEPAAEAVAEAEPEPKAEAVVEPTVESEPEPETAAAESEPAADTGAAAENEAESPAEIPSAAENKGVEDVEMDWKVEGETEMDTIGTAGAAMAAAADVTAQPVQTEAAAEETASGRTANDEVAVITASMKITGDMVSDGSMDVVGTVEGNIDILGKLNITGTIVGNSKAMEVYAENARVTGEITTDGSVKVGQSSVIIGNIYATSAVIAGAVKGDIDVQGPVVLDTTAIVMGNIKSKSVQINNGAIIEGMCSQCYADVNPTSFFESFQ